MERNPVSDVIFGAIRDNKINLIRYWVDNKINFNEDIDEEGYTPLMAAIREENVKIVELLIEGKADVNDPMEEDPFFNPLEYAIMQDNSKDNHKIIELLLKAGADKENALRHALFYNSSFENIKVLIDNGVKVNTPGNGTSPLEHAIQACRLEVVELLIDEGAHVNMHSSGGMIPLNFAISHFRCTDKIPIIKLLIKSGASLSKKDGNDSTPLEVAVVYGYSDIVRILLDAGAKIDKRIILKAAKYGYKDIVHMLLEAGAPVDKEIIDNATRNIKPILTAWVRLKPTERAATILNKINKNSNLPRLPAELRGKITSYFSGTNGRQGVQNGPKQPGQETNYIGNQLRKLEMNIGNTRGGTRRARSKKRRLTRKN